MAPLSYETVDAFTSQPFKGNPCAVVIFDPTDSRRDDDSFLLSLAKEFNYQESAFLVPLFSSASQGPTYSLRWFTPTCEFPLCGHGTLAAAHSIFSSHLLGAELLRFETLSGTLTARRLAGGKIELEFPADELEDTESVGEEEEGRLRAAVSRASAEFEGRVLGLAKGRLGWVVELANEVKLEKVRIDVSSFELPLGGYIVFTQPAPVDAPEDIRSRVFDPVEDIPEDPVTGSAHCMLAPYWLGRPGPRSRIPQQLGFKEKDGLRARQVSSRGGDLEVVWVRETGRIKLRGEAVTVMQGRLLL